MKPVTGKRLFFAWLILMVLGALGALAFTWLLPAPPTHVVRGAVLGDVENVLLVLANKGVAGEARLEPDGSFEVDVPDDATRPRIEALAKGGGRILVPLLEGQTELEPFALWSTGMRFRVDGDKVRVDWSPIPEGEGYPRGPRYSLLLAYTRTNGDRQEVSSLAERQLEKHALDLSLAELEDFMPERDPAKPVEVELRVYEFAEGSRLWKWIGHRCEWLVGQPLVSPLPGE